MKGEIVSVQTKDGVGLDGLLVRPEGPSRLPVDIVIMHHGVGGRFYHSRVFDPQIGHLAEEGCAALCVNSRGHDVVYSNSDGRLLGAAYEVVDDCRYDWDAWISYAAGLGYQRIGLWGHSLGAVKTIYYMAVAGHSRVPCAIASSPPRQNYETYLAQPPAERELYLKDYEPAKKAMDEGDPERLITTAYRRSMPFTARTFVDKYGPGARYDIVKHLPNVKIPLLVTLGGLEPIPENPGRVSHYETPDLMARLTKERQNLSYAEIPGADHPYTGKAKELWDAVRGWYKGL